MSDHANLPEKLTAKQVSSLLGCCSGSLAKLIWQGQLAPPDDRGLFARDGLFASQAYRTRRGRS